MRPHATSRLAYDPRAIAFLGLLSLTGCAGAPSPARRATDPQPVVEATPPVTQALEAPFRLPDSVVPRSMVLDLRIDPANSTFEGTAQIDLELTEAAAGFWIHAKNLEVVSVRIERSGATAEASFRIVDGDEGMAWVGFAERMEPGPARATFSYRAPFDTTLEGLYRVESDGRPYVFSQFEALAARKAFPCFDEPRFKIPFEIRVSAPTGQRAFSNARELETTESDGWTTTRFARTEALPTYLVAFAVGPFDVVERTLPPRGPRTTPLVLRGLAVEGRGPQLAYAMEHTPRIVEALEAWFGSPYPFDKLDIVAVPDFSAGAMENAGLVTFRDQLLLMDASAAVQQRRGFAFVMAHELAHQWFGNLVTMAWWDDLWLNEAFASWMETPIVEATFPEFQAETLELMTQFEAFGADSLVSARVIRQPIVSSDDIANAFDSITYSKGASILAMVRTSMGPERFQTGIRAYLAAHARGNATSANLMASLAEAAPDVPVAAILESFTTQAGIPLLEFGPIECSSDRRRASIRLRQSRHRPAGSTAEAQAAWTVPVCVWHPDARGRLAESCTPLPTSEGVLELTGCPAWIWPNPEGRAYMRFALDATQTEALRPLVERAMIPPGRLARPRPWAIGVDLARAYVPGTRDLRTLADAASAGVESGAMTFESAMAIVEPMANSPERFVATSAFELLSEAEPMLEPSQRDAFRVYVRRLYQPQRTRLGLAAVEGESTEQRSLRASLLSFLAFTADDPEVRRPMAQLGHRIVAADGFHPDVTAPDLLDVALGVLAEDADAATFDRLVAALMATTDGMHRRRLVGAIGRVRDPGLRLRTLELALDERLRLNERFAPMNGQFADEDGREAAWAWLQANYDRVASRLGPDYAGYLPMLTQVFCSEADAERVRSFFAPRIDATIGGPRNLESATESIRLCVVRRDAQRASVTRFFAQWERPDDARVGEQVTPTRH